MDCLYQFSLTFLTFTLIQMDRTVFLVFLIFISFTLVFFTFFITVKLVAMRSMINYILVDVDLCILLILQWLLFYH